MLRVGDIVRTVREIRTNPVVAERRGWEPVPKDAIGVVVTVKQTNLNACYNRSGKGDVYVDVHIFDDGTGKPWKAGNYHSGSFSKLI
tara:strand:- start:924 stop:1184 length:261 start_codon:yes stop_codon:yes gene_type:complete